MARTVHIIGAGLAGLAAAIQLSERGTSVVVHEATQMAGGRCRSYHDHAIGMVIDNGNHLLLSGNTSAMAYLKAIGATDRLIGPPAPEFPFIDLAANERWTLKFNKGWPPTWIFSDAMRVPNTRATDYLPFLRLVFAAKDKTVGEVYPFSGAAYERLLKPVLLAALNVDPPLGSAALAGAVIRETILMGGAASRPLFARDGLGSALVEPALTLLAQRNMPVRLGHQLRGIRLSDQRAEELDFGDEKIALAAGDSVIVAVPPYAAASLIPGLETPNVFHAIVNAHYRIAPPPGQPPVMGVVNATTEWLFAFPGRLSVTVSAGDRLIDAPREALARTIWEEIAAITGLPKALPPWQIVRERRATFAGTPEQDARRPATATQWSNLALAGDWTKTGLPATIESAIRSGQRAATLVAKG
jgi:squalene-associated FAD-dependent desaturase